MNKVRKLFRLMRALVQINKFNNTNSVYHRLAKARLNDLETSLTDEIRAMFPKNMVEKMQWYIAEFLFVGEAFNTLLDRELTHEQKEIYVRLGILIALCDLMIDDASLEIVDVELLKHPGKNPKQGNEIHKLYASLYHQFVDSLPSEVKQQALHYYELMFDAQVRSKRQFDPNISTREVDEICSEKCGYSMLLLMVIISHEISAKEVQAFYEVGAFIQFCNDVQDLHKDLQKGMRTFASVRPNIETIAHDLEQQRAMAFSLVKATTLDEKRKDDFLFVIFVMYQAILVKLEIFSRLCGNQFTWEQFRLLDKWVVRSSTTAFKLLVRVVPRILRQNKF